MMNAVKYYRLQNGMSQRELDRRAGIHSVLMMENTDPVIAAASIATEDYLAVSNVLGVSVDDLFRTDLPIRND